MERIQIKKIINTAKIEFKKWILDTRMLVLAVLMTAMATAAPKS